MLLILNKLGLNKDLAILFIGRVLQVILSFIGLRVMTTLFSIDELGNYYLILSITFFFSYILLSPVAMFFSRHLVEWEERKVTLNAFLKFFLFIALSSIVTLMLSFVAFISLGYQEKFGLVAFLVVVSLTVLVSATHRNILTGINILRSRKIFIVAMVATLGIGLFFAFCISYFYEAKAIYWLYGVLAAEIITLPFVFKYFISGYKFDMKALYLKTNMFEIKNVTAFSLPIVGTNIFLWGQIYSYRIIVDHKYGAEILGAIGVALAITTAVFAALENLISSYYYPIYLREINSASKELRDRAWNKMANKIIPIYLLTVFFMLAMSKSLIGILVDEKFHYVYVFTLVAVGLEFFRVMTNLLNYALQTEYKTKLAIMPYLTGVMFTLTSFIFIDFSQNYEAIVWVLVIGGACIYLYILKNVRNIITMQYNFNYKEIFILIVPYFIYAMVNKPDYSFLENFLIVSLSCIYFLFAAFRISRDKRGYLK